MILVKYLFQILVDESHSARVLIGCKPINIRPTQIHCQRVEINRSSSLILPKFFEFLEATPSPYPKSQNHPLPYLIFAGRPKYIDLRGPKGPDLRLIDLRETMGPISDNVINKIKIYLFENNLIIDT